MGKYIVSKRVLANEFVFVTASSEKEAIEMVVQGEGKTVRNNLEYLGELPQSMWVAEDITKYKGDNNDGRRSTLLCD